MTANHSTGRVEPITGQNESKNTKSWTQKGITSTSLHHRNIKTTSTDRVSQDEDNNTFPIVVTQKTSEISSITSRKKTQHATGEWMCLLVGTDSSTQTSKIQHKKTHIFISSSTFKQATTKTEDSKKPQVPRDQRTTTGTIPCATLIEHRHKTIARSNDDADSDSCSRRSSAPTSERRPIYDPVYCRLPNISIPRNYLGGNLSLYSTSENGLDRNSDADTRCATERFERHRYLARWSEQQRRACEIRTVATNQTLGLIIWIYNQKTFKV